MVTYWRMREKRFFTLFLLNIRYFFLILNEPTGPHQHTDEHQLEASASFTSFSTFSSRPRP
jgi:hypothetical protein